MQTLNKIEKELLEQISSLHNIEECSVNIRKNGQCVVRQTNADIEIENKKDKEGINIFVKDGTKNKGCHIPVILSVSGLTDTVYNDFYIGNNVDITIVAGCGISCGGGKSEHNGIHRFFIGENSKIKYIEKHLGLGNGGERVINPITKVFMKKNSECDMITTQISGITDSKRTTYARLDENAVLNINETLFTTDNQTCETHFKVVLEGKNSKAHIVSRSVAKDNSKQNFYSSVIGKNACFGHIECDGILTGHSRIASTPKIDAGCEDALLVHEAMIGKISNDQILKLMSLGLSKEEAEQEIINGFLSSKI